MKKSCIFHTQIFWDGIHENTMHSLFVFDNKPGI